MGRPKKIIRLRLEKERQLIHKKKSRSPVNDHKIGGQTLINEIQTVQNLPDIILPFTLFPPALPLPPSPPPTISLFEATKLLRIW